MTYTVDAALLVLFAIVWVMRGGCDRIIVALFAAYAVSISVGPALHGMERHVLMWVIDAAIVFGMASMWTARDDMRAYSVGLLGLFQIGWRLAFATGLDVSHLAFAVAINIAVALQILAAGGVIDVVGHWLDDRLRLLFPRRYRLLRNVEGA